MRPMLTSLAMLVAMLCALLIVWTWLVSNVSMSPAHISTKSRLENEFVQ